MNSDGPMGQDESKRLASEESGAEATASLERVARKLAHDLRGPLNTIVLSASALLRRAPDSDRKSLEMIVRNAGRATALVAEALEQQAAAAPAHLEPPEPAVDEPAPAGHGVERRAYRTLLVEDNIEDARVLRSELADSGAFEFQLTHAASLAEAKNLMRQQSFDLLLLDLFLADSQGLETVAAVQPLAGSAAVVVLTGVADRETAIAAVRQGAQDYLIKAAVDGPSIVRAMYYAMERKGTLVEREQLIDELQAALATVKKLSGLLPICASCKRIRDDDGAWNHLEDYIHNHSEAQFSHGICPECAKTMFPDAFDG
jgi:two-component system, response regulator PdtaR